MQDLIQIYSFNEYGSKMRDECLSKEDALRYLLDNIEDITKIQLVRKFSKVFHGESANPLAYTQDCTTIEKEDIKGNLSKIEFCPFEIAKRGLTQEEQQLFATNLEKDEAIVWDQEQGYQKIKEEKQYIIPTEKWDNKELFIETCSHPENVISGEELSNFLEKSKGLAYERFLEKNREFEKVDKDIQNKNAK